MDKTISQLLGYGRVNLFRARETSRREKFEGQSLVEKEIEMMRSND
jgi:hypothetical protein